MAVVNKKEVSKKLRNKLLNQQIQTPIVKPKIIKMLHLDGSWTKHQFKASFTI